MYSLQCPTDLFETKITIVSRSKLRGEEPMASGEDRERRNLGGKRNPIVQ